MHPMWKTYKSKVLKTLNPELEEDTAEEVQEVENDVSPVQEDEGPNAVSQLAKRVQGAGARGWNRMSALFTKEDEHQLLEETEAPPVPDHPLAVRPEEPRPARRSGFWDSFTTKWQQKQAEEAAAAAAAGAASAGEFTEEGQEGVSRGGEQEEVNAEGGESQGGESSNNSNYTSLGGGGEEPSAFKWNFVTSKLADLKAKSMTKTN
ncbi:uncharacterized protein C1orf232 [Aplochiton taeniatus]